MRGEDERDFGKKRENSFFSRHEEKIRVALKKVEAASHFTKSLLLLPKAVLSG